MTTMTLRSRRTSSGLQGSGGRHWATTAVFSLVDGIPFASASLELPNTPDPETLGGPRDRAILALLIGCGLRRAEILILEVDQIQQRAGRWVIPDLVGKGKRRRTVPVPSWVKFESKSDACRGTGRSEGEALPAGEQACCACSSSDGRCFRYRGSLLRKRWYTMRIHLRHVPADAAREDNVEHHARAHPDPGNRQAMRQDIGQNVA
jgi:hypothetical protein